MSLIFGINLSDRIYIASDTRVTHRKDGSETHIDCIYKNGQIGNDIAVATAGDIRLTGYLYSELKKAKFVQEGINSVRENIKKWAANRIDKFLKTNPYTTACLIIAGLDRSRRKIVDGKKLISLTKEFQDLQPGTPLIMKDAIFKGISAKPNQPNPLPQLPVCDSAVFSLKSDTKHRILEIENAEWGQYLAYGPKGFTKEDMPKTLFGQLEFEKGCGNVFRDGGLITAFIKSTTEQKKLGSVGGSIVVNAVTEELGVVLVSGITYRQHSQTGKVEVVSKIEVINGKMYGQTEAGLMVRLIDFHKYKYGRGQYLF